MIEWTAQEGKNYQIHWSNGPIGPNTVWHEVYRPEFQRTGSTLSWIDDGTRTYTDDSRERYYRIVVEADR
jgi:hypothetical protein